MRVGGAGAAANQGGADAGEITLADRDRLIAGLPQAKRPPAEYAFANLILFRARHRYRIVGGEIPHLSGITYDGARHALPLGPIDRAGAAALLAEHDCLFPFGDEAVVLAGSLGLTWRVVDADSDYIYDAVRMAKLDGAKTRRAQATAFEGEHRPRYDPVQPGMADTLLHVAEGWLADVGRDPDATDIEECRQAIALYGPLGLRGALVSVANDEPVAFLLATARDDGEHVIHFAKARRAHSAAQPWMFARYAATSGAVRLNFEQGLGNAGFAQAKRAYAPVELRRKYRLYRG